MFYYFMFFVFTNLFCNMMAGFYDGLLLKIQSSIYFYLMNCYLFYLYFNKNEEHWLMLEHFYPMLVFKIKWNISLILRCYSYQ